MAGHPEEDKESFSYIQSSQRSSEDLWDHPRVARNGAILLHDTAENGAF